MNIARTVFICLVLALSSLLFSKDANELVIGPIENMIATIKRIAKNPLDAVHEDEVNSLALEQYGKLKNGKKQVQQMETEVLENIIVKIGALLALGFGEAGSEIITSNIKRGGGDIDPMIPGKKTYCIFGFCDIRDFADVTEVLQEGVMVFVNEIAQIVHSTVYRFSGSANKNIGDAFFLVWKIPKTLELYVHPDAEERCPYELHQYADLALVAFMKILAAINSDLRILKYRLSAELLKRMPYYSVKMGFGLHVGWAIEGAIGSEFKIDASYLSPNVNLASRLEGATRQFGVPILISGQLFDLFSTQVQLLTRQVDRVLVKGSKVPMRLYTCDVSTEYVPRASTDEMLADLTRRQAKVELKKQREHILKTALSKQQEVWRLFETDIQLIAMRSKLNTLFLDVFRDGFAAYIKGDWEEARKNFLYGREIKGEADGPSQALLDFMDERGGQAPADWKGFRELTEK